MSKSGDYVGHSACLQRTVAHHTVLNVGTEGLSITFCLFSKGGILSQASQNRSNIPQLSALQLLLLQAFCWLAR